MKYTAGPWHVRAEIDGMPAVENRKTRVFDAQGMQVASTFNQTRVHLQYTFDAAEANAVLIAAAPELLELVNFVLACEGNDYAVDDQWVTRAEAAIAKAEGREP